VCHNFLVVTVKKGLKSVYIYRSYYKNKLGGPFFGTPCRVVIGRCWTDQLYHAVKNYVVMCGFVRFTLTDYCTVLAVYTCLFVRINYVWTECLL